MADYVPIDAPFEMPIRANGVHHRAMQLVWNPTQEDRAQAKANHGQTLERLKERGGMSWCEMAVILEHRPWRKMEWREAFGVCQDALLARDGSRRT